MLHVPGEDLMIRTALGICGWKNSGKTTLIESLVPLLEGKGLAVAVIKHDAHGLQVDHPGKDSDRFYRAGADVLLQGPEEEVLRRSLHAPPALESALARLSPCYDLILVEGHKKTSLPKVWLHGKGDSPPPEGVEDILF